MRRQIPAHLATDDSGQNQGGLWMRVRHRWLFLDLFVLAAKARRGGTGTRILAMAEDAARARGCTGIWLDTYGFQAPDFYRRHGYQQKDTVVGMYLGLEDGVRLEKVLRLPAAANTPSPRMSF